MKKGMSSGRRKKKKADLNKKKNGSRKTGTLNIIQELTRKIKQTYNNIMIWNQVQENLTKSREIFLSCAKEKLRKKLIETLDLRQKSSM